MNRRAEPYGCEILPYIELVHGTRLGLGASHETDLSRIGRRAGSNLGLLLLESFTLGVVLQDHVLPSMPHRRGFLGVAGEAGDWREKFAVLVIYDEG